MLNLTVMVKQWRAITGFLGGDWVRRQNITRCANKNPSGISGQFASSAYATAIFVLSLTISTTFLTTTVRSDPQNEAKVLYFTLTKTLTSPDPEATLQRIFTVGDQLVVQLGDTDIARVEPKLNRIEWRKTPGGTIRHVFVVENSLLVVADDLSLWAISDGSRKWTYPLAMQNLLSVDAEAAVVAGFGDHPTQVAMVDLQTGGLAWPSWAMVDKPSWVYVEPDRLLVVSEAAPGQVIPVDRSTGRVRNAIAAPHDPGRRKSLDTWKTERFGDRVLLLSDFGAGWVTSATEPVATGQGSQLIVQVGPESHLYEGTPLREAVEECQRKVSQHGETECVVNLLPLAGKLPGVDDLAPGALKSLATWIADPQSDRQKVVNMAVKLLPMVRNKDGKSDRTLVVRFARIVIALSNTGEHGSAQKLLTELIPLAGDVQLQGLAFATQLAYARTLIQEGQRAMQRGNRDEAVARLDDLVTLSAIAGLLPAEIVDARDGDKQLRAAYKAVLEILPTTADGNGQNQSMCMAECGLDRDECGTHPRCKDLYSACIVGCAPAQP